MDFLTADNGEYRWEIKRSQFIGRIKKVNSEDEAKDFVLSIKKQESMATHNCYSYIVFDDGTERIRYSDDGEPQGTAGLPILNVLKNRDLHNVAVVVTRYFGGVKLGAGGLVRAYSESCSGAVNNAKVSKCVECDLFNIDFSYENYKFFGNFRLPKYSIIKSTEYGMSVSVKLVIGKEESEKFVEDFNNFYNKRQPISLLSTVYEEFEGEKE